MSPARNEILRHFVPQNDNTDGRLRIADGRYRVVGNRRPLRWFILHIVGTGVPRLSTWHYRETMQNNRKYVILLFYVILSEAKNLKKTKIATRPNASLRVTVKKTGRRKPPLLHKIYNFR